MRKFLVIRINRDVLHDIELLKSLRDEKVILWGGDVMERDAYQGKTLILPSVLFVTHS